ncbi:MAG: hypothetical protein KGJ84_16895 [Elusimicrobia bacterium]|nr:hypothetical protein [Elusimicrobiota bacterium]
MNPKKTDRHRDGLPGFPISPVMRLFAGTPRPSGDAVLRTLPADWKAKLIRVEPSYDLELRNVVNAGIFFDLPGLDPADFLSYDAYGSAEAYDRFSKLVPMLTRWMTGMPEVRPWGGGGKLLIHGLARCFVKYIAGDEAGDICGLFTATLTRGEGSSTLLAADLLEWRRGRSGAPEPDQ